MHHCLFSPSFFAIIFLSSCFIFPHAKAENSLKGFTVDLIHRDSPNSPFYDPLSTPFEYVENAYQRSLWRSRKFTSPALILDGGEYLLKTGLGTPPFEFYANADTGSDTSWVQCLPCINCYKEKYLPFDPNKSSTFQFLPCESEECNLLPPNSRACKSTKTCLYNESYGDGSFTKGDLMTETLTFFGSGGEQVSFPNILFGCGHENEGIFSQNSSGLVGFGTRNLSLASQLKSSIDGKFSFCLGPSSTQVTNAGKLSFGSDAIVSGPDVVSTPLIIDQFYYLILDAISVGNKRFQFPQLKESRKLDGGNIIIDSGTTYTFLPSDVYKKVEAAVKDEIKSNNTVKDPLGIFPLCYSSLKDAHIPLIAFHFKDADVELKPLNIFVNTSSSSLCLAFVSTTDLPVYGNVIQMNFLVGYDIVNKIISFKNVDCTK